MVGRGLVTPGGEGVVIVPAVVSHLVHPAHQHEEHRDIDARFRVAERW